MTDIQREKTKRFLVTPRIITQRDFILTPCTPFRIPQNETRQETKQLITKKINVVCYT